MEPKKFKSERDTQIVTEHKVTIRKGDDVTVNYVKNDKGEINSAIVELNGSFIGRYNLQELEEFLQIFFSDTF